MIKCTTCARHLAYQQAAINFNDGFGGGNEITENLLFNTCRESSDHGAFNSWDRCVQLCSVVRRRVRDARTESGRDI